MSDFNKLLELLLTMGKGMKENKPLQKIIYWALALFGGAVFLHALAALLSALAPSGFF